MCSFEKGGLPLSGSVHLGIRFVKMMTISHKCHGFHLAPKNEQLNSKVFQFPSRIGAGMYRRCLKRRELCFAMSFPFETLKDTGKTPIFRESILIFHKTEQFEIKFLVLLCIRKWSRGENFLFFYPEHYIMENNFRLPSSSSPEESGQARSFKSFFALCFDFFPNLKDGPFRAPFGGKNLGPL